MGPQIACPSCAGQAKAWAGLAEQTGGLVTLCLSARLENGQLQEDGEQRGQGMEYPPWGLVSCWGRKLLGVRCLLQTQVCEGWGAMERDKNWAPLGYTGASRELRLVGRAPPSDL